MYSIIWCFRNKVQNLGNFFWNTIINHTSINNKLPLSIYKALKSHNNPLQLKEATSIPMTILNSKSLPKNCKIKRNQLIINHRHHHLIQQNTLLTLTTKVYSILFRKIKRALLEIHSIKIVKRRVFQKLRKQSLFRTRVPKSLLLLPKSTSSFRLHFSRYWEGIKDYD